HVDGAVLNAGETVTRLKADYTELIPKLNSLFDAAKRIATNTDLAMQKVNGLVDRLDGVVRTNEGDLGKALAELRVVSQNLKVISTYTKSLSATLAEKPSSL